MPRKRVILKKKYPQYPVGFGFKMYGHRFTIQKDGTAAANIDTSLIKSELAAGRYILAQGKSGSNKEAKNKPLKTHIVDQFSYDLGTYYGAGSLSKLQEKITAMRKAEISFFAETRLSTEFPARMGKDRMVHQLIEMIDANYQTANPEIEEELPEEIIVEDIEDIEEKEETPVEKLDKADPMPITDAVKKDLKADLEELEKLAKQKGE